MCNPLKQVNNPLLFEMTMLCKITWKDNELLCELSGVISAEELHKINLGHQGDPRWNDLRYLIADFYGTDTSWEYGVFENLTEARS